MKFGRNQAINDKDRVFTSANFIHRQAAGILVAILVIVHWTKYIFNLETEFDESNPYMKPIKNLAINDSDRVFTSANQQAAAILVAILVIVHHDQTKPIYELC